MPRRARLIAIGIPHHVTQRGVDRCPVFDSDFDRGTYLRLLGDHHAEAQVRVLGWCLMTNHVHLILLPEQPDSLALLLRRLHGRYAQYFNARAGRSGHLWQNRYFACPLGPAHVLPALAYVDANPVRAGLVERATEYPWSSALAHCRGVDAAGLMDEAWWRAAGIRQDWETYLRSVERDVELEKCTYAGRPYGDRNFIAEMGNRFRRQWTRGRPKKERVLGAVRSDAGGGLFADEF